VSCIFYKPEWKKNNRICLKVAVDFGKKINYQKEALLRIAPSELNNLLHKQFDQKF
jgi:hypothetical protein